MGVLLLAWLAWIWATRWRTVVVTLGVDMTGHIEALAGQLRRVCVCFRVEGGPKARQGDG